MGTLLSESIDRGVNEKYYGAEGRKRYNKSGETEKSFQGNIIMFSQSKDQYNKRFPVNSCCGQSRFPTWEDAMEMPDRISGDDCTIDNTVKWGDVSVCEVCGHIFEEKSNFDNVVIPESKEEPEPSEDEILKAVSQIDLSEI